MSRPITAHDCGAMKEIRAARGLPVIDKRRCPFRPADPAGGPRPHGRGWPAPDPPPWHALSHAPLAVIAAARSFPPALQWTRHWRVRLFLEVMMADYFCQFSCLFDVGSAANAACAAGIREALAAELEREDGSRPGFEISAEPASGPGALWIHSDESGEPEHVVRFVLRCAAAFDLHGVWGFAWSLGCAKPRVDAFGGGAQVIDLGARVTLGGIDCGNWVIERTTEATEPGSSADRRARELRFRELSSGHLAAETWAWLDTGFADDKLRDPKNSMASQLAGSKTRHGWLVYAPNWALPDVPQELVRILTDARRGGYDYVLFDCNAAADRNYPLAHPDFAGRA